MVWYPLKKIKIYLNILQIRSDTVNTNNLCLNVKCLQINLKTTREYILLIINWIQV